MVQQQLYRIEIINRQQSFLCAANQVLLIGMERRNISSINVGCRGGGCGVCKVRIIDGDYETKRMSRAHISAVEEEQGFALACRVLPRSDLLIEADQHIASQKPPSSAKCRKGAADKQYKSKVS